MSRSIRDWLRAFRPGAAGPLAGDHPLALALGLAIVVVAAGVLAWIVLPEDGPRRAAVSTERGPGPSGFVYRVENRLYLDGRRYRFVGVNYPWANNLGQLGCGPPIDDRTLERVLDRAAAAGNAVRSWFFQPQATASGVRDWTAFDRTLRAVRERKLKVIVTLSDSHGYCGADPPGGFKDIAWYRAGYAETLTPGFPATFREYVRELVTRYADRPEILAWQLINEANVVTAEVGCVDERAAARVLRAWADDLAGLIRSIDPHHLISLGTGVQGPCGTEVTAEPADNDYHYIHSSPEIDLCEYHDYGAPSVALFDPQRLAMDACREAGKAFFVGELGIDQTLPERPALLAAKLEAQFQYSNEPLQGALVWRFGGSGTGGWCDRNCVTLNDPVVDVLARFE